MLLTLAQGPAPAEFGWWLASRASGIVALLCITVSVGIGLAMAGKIAARPLGAQLMALHQHTALAGLVAIAVHGLTLLGDAHLSPSLGDIAIPFTSEHEPLWTGLGVTGGWLAAALGLTYYVRDKIGPKRWRSLHKLTIFVYVLGVAHTLGAGTDAGAAVAAGDARAHRRAGALPLRHARAHAAPGARVPAVPRRRPDARERDGPVADARPRRQEADRAAPARPVRAGPRRPALTRSYSLSAAPGGERYRISVKREPGGRMSEHLHDEGRRRRRARGRQARGPLRPGRAEHAARRAAQRRHRRHAGAGDARRARDGGLDRRAVWWLHGARCGSEHPFRDEVRARLARLPGAQSYVTYSRPDPWDEPLPSGRLTAETVLRLGVPLDADFHLCGTPGFVKDLTDGLRAAGAERDHERELRRRDAGPARRRARAGARARGAGGPAIAFARSDVSTTWDESFSSLLDLAEAHAVPNEASCRIGSCHGCKATVLSGAVHHDPEPIDPPEAGSVLLCCARPQGDLVLDA